MIQYQIELALIEAIKEKRQFTVIGFSKGFIITRDEFGYWIEI